MNTNQSIVFTSIITISLLVGSLATPLTYGQEVASFSEWGEYGHNSGRFNQPSGIAVTPSGNTLVADTGNNRIQVLSSNGTFISQWGEYGSGDDQFRTPTDIALVSNDTVLVADTGNNRIQVLSSNGTFISQWGEFGSGNGRFNQPSGIAVTPSGNIVVADTGNNRIQVLSHNGTFISQWGGYGRDDEQLKSPTDIAVTPSGNILVADTGNNRIQVLSSNGTFMSKFGKYGRGDGRFNQPTGIAVTPSGNILVADTENNRIQMLSHNGTFISKFGKYGRGDDQFRTPTDIAVTSTDAVLVADRDNNRIAGFNVDYAINQTVQDTLSQNVTINNPNLSVKEIATDLQFPTAIAFMGPQDIIVLERLSGVVKRIVNGTVLKEPLLNLSNYKVGSCMCGIDIAKRNNTTYVFLYIAELQTDASNIAERLYRYELVDNNTRLANPKILLDIPISSLRGIHHGGKVLVGPDSNVYVIIGDIDGRDTKAQNVVDGPGPDGSSSILRMTVDGEAVKDNDMLGNTTPMNKYYGYGIRNSFGFDFDPVTNRLWFTDNGGSTGDEINLVEPGFNGGWKEVMGMSSLKKSFDRSNLVNFDGKGKYIDPQFEWLNAIGPTALTFLDSDALGKEYQNDFFVGDINNGNIYHFELNHTRTGLSLNGSLSDKIANNLQEASQVVFARGMGGVTDMKVGPEGILYVVSALGKIYAVMPSSEAVDNSTTSTM